MADKSTIFITGASGFIGRRLATRLAADGNYRVIGMGRNADILHSLAGIDPLSADLFDPASYREALQSATTVIHLAAATGKQSRSDYYRVNRDGTAALLAACRDAGVQRFIFVSTIATHFPDLAHYPYADAKAAAETLVTDSGLDYAIVRPTLVIGPGSGVWESLSTLAGAPLMPVFGKGDTKIQPIFVDDLVTFLRRLTQNDTLGGKNYDAGGPETTTIGAFMEQIARRRGQLSPRKLHIPMGLLLLALRPLEKVAFDLLPLNSGQLSPFRFDSLPVDTAIDEQLLAQFADINTMIDRTVNDE